jgi:predicted nucleotidyltransferase
LGSAEVRYLKINLNEVLEELKKYAASKSADYGTKAIILVGSLAKGTYTGISDADILVIADDVPASSLDRYALFADPSLSIDLEPRVYKTKEFLRKVQQGDRFAIESTEIGIPLFGESFFEKLKSMIRHHPISNGSDMIS